MMQEWSNNVPKPTRNPFLRRQLALLTDRLDCSSDLVRILSKAGELQIAPIAALWRDFSNDLSGFIVDVDLLCPKTVQCLREKMHVSQWDKLPRLFVIGHASHHDAMQAWALGATDTITRPLNEDSVLRRIRSAFPHPIDPDLHSVNSILADKTAAAHAEMVRIYTKLPAGSPLRLDDIIEAEETIIDAIKGSSLHEWLDAVGRYDSQISRHCLFAAGFAVAFSERLGLQQSDRHRLTRSALLFDVGKAFIPRRVLDKPGKLTSEEWREVRCHPQRAYEVLAAKGEFPREMLDVVLHHHEFLDGSGYPHGLRGEQICDIVRLITIIDIYTALIEPRPYRLAFDGAEAFCILECMRGQIDQKLLAAFGPVALSH